MKKLDFTFPDDHEDNNTSGASDSHYCLFSTFLNNFGDRWGDYPLFSKAGVPDGAETYFTGQYGPNELNVLVRTCAVITPGGTCHAMPRSCV
ncbi:hypothetical protein [Yokenella regensburgei]|uniref:hypothetical protein n=1 Tax=Yokenella regensburgei TaxID=158877 RepID=UPI001432FB46|nr:hypothetical protein [Yokenella regensburgei]QIU88438.1 hypothetical protein HEC60_03220 [Yokenella regensburgei]